MYRHFVPLFSFFFQEKGTKSKMQRKGKLLIIVKHSFSKHFMICYKQTLEQLSLSLLPLCSRLIHCRYLLWFFCAIGFSLAERGLAGGYIQAQSSGREKIIWQRPSSPKGDGIRTEMIQPSTWLSWLILRYIHTVSQRVHHEIEPQLSLLET